MKLTAPLVGRPLTLVTPPCQVPQLTPSVGSLPALASVAPLGEIAGLTAVSPKLTPSLPRGAVKPATEPDVPCCASPCAIIVVPDCGPTRTFLGCTERLKNSGIAPSRCGRSTA